MNTTIIVTVALTVVVTLFALFVIQSFQIQHRIRQVPLKESLPLIYKKAVEDRQSIEEEVKAVQLSAKPATTKPIVMKALHVETPAHN